MATISAEALPSHFPIFPLRGALLLPGGNIPLNIFEPRYLAMVRDAMRTDHIIGMVQPRREDDPSSRPQTYAVGCAGRISNLAETPDGRFLIVLSGVCRFDIAEELEVGTPYRQVKASFKRWRCDLAPPEPEDRLRLELLRVLKGYLTGQEITADWGQLQNAPLASLVTALAMICPFSPSEKQALLEASDLNSQAELLVALMNMAALGGEEGSAVRH